MTDDNKPALRPYGFYQHFHQLLDDLCFARGMPDHGDLAREMEIDPKNVGNWRRGDNLPTSGFLRRLESTLNLPGDPELHAQWRTLYSKARKDRRDKRNAAVISGEPVVEEDEGAGVDETPPSTPQELRLHASGSNGLPRIDTDNSLPEPVYVDALSTLRDPINSFSGVTERPDTFEPEVSVSVTSEQTSSQTHSPPETNVAKPVAQPERDKEAVRPTVKEKTQWYHYLGAIGTCCTILWLGWSAAKEAGVLPSWLQRTVINGPPGSSDQPKPPGPSTTELAQKRLAIDLAECERLAAPSFDPVTNNGNQGVSWYVLQVPKAQSTCGKALETAQNILDDAALIRLRFLNARIELADQLQKVFALREQVVAILNKEPLLVKSVTNDSAVRRKSSLEDEEAALTKRIRAVTDEIFRQAHSGYFPAIIEMIAIQYWDVWKDYSRQAEITDERLINQIKDITNKYPSLKTNPTLLALSCRLRLSPYFVFSTQSESTDANKIIDALGDCQKAKAESEPISEPTLALAEFYQLKNISNGEKIENDSHAGRLSRGKIFLELYRKDSLRYFRGVSSDAAWVFSTYPSSMEDIRAAAAAYEHAYILGRNTAINLCGIYGMEWAYEIENRLPEAWQEGFNADRLLYFNDKTRIVRMANYCDLASKANSDMGVFYMARAHVSGEAEDVGVALDIERAITLLIKYRASQQASDKNDRRNRARDRLSEICEAFAYPDKADWRYQKTAHQFLEPAKREERARHMQLSCQAAFDAGSIRAGTILYFSSIGAIDGLLARTSPAFDIIQRIVNASMDEKRQSSKDRPALTALNTMCRAYFNLPNADDYARSNIAERLKNPSKKILAEQERQVICNGAIVSGSSEFSYDPK